MRRTLLVMGWTLLGAIACASGSEAGDSGVDGSASSSSIASTPASAADSTPTPPAAPTPVPAGTSPASGAFTAAQATSGHEVYTNTCANCHTAAQHSGATFASTWNNRRVFDLYEIIYNTMPVDNPGSLSDQEYVDVVAYILQLNGHRPGKAALMPDAAALKALRIEIQPGTGE